MPVSFNIPVQMGALGAIPFGHCGVYLVPSTGPVKFIWTMGRDTDLPLHCFGLDAVGIQPLENDKPAIILLYRSEDPGLNEPFRQPFILTWDKQSNSYTINDAWSNAASDLGPNVTIRDIQRLK